MVCESQNAQAKYRCVSPKKLRRAGLVPLVGDEVIFDAEASIILQFLPRKNSLIRPAVCNIDALIIVAAPRPEPDFLLIDKLAVAAIAQKIEIIIAANKSDINGGESLFEKLKADYASFCRIFNVCALSGEGTEQLFEAICGKTACLAGASGVGKTSLLVRLLDTLAAESGGSNLVSGENTRSNAKKGVLKHIAGELSQKNQRGKNTTRQTSLLPLKANARGGYICDTPGFQSLDELQANSAELTLFYPDFAPFFPNCRFNMCTHINEPGCAVKAAAECGELSQGRYARYKMLHSKLQEAEKNKY